MKLIKSILPLLFVTTLLIPAYIYYDSATAQLQSALKYLPVLMIAIATMVAFYLNRIRVLILTLVVAGIYFFLENDFMMNEYQLSLLALFFPVLILIANAIPNYGIVSVKAIVPYLVILLLSVGIFWLSKGQPAWFSPVLELAILPEKYFDWSPVSQTVVFYHALLFIILSSVWSYKQNTASANSLGIFIILLVVFYLKAQDKDLIILICSALLLNIVSLLKDSWNMAYLDELTQIPGRRALNEKLASLVGIYSVAMVDIDHFKKFNDSFGHDVGDEALQMVANKLKRVGGNGVAYRYGGEEFCLVFPNKDVSLISEHLENLRKEVEDTNFVVNRGKTSKVKKSVKITVSIGAADSVNINSSLQVVEKADKALYKSKKKGRNCVVIS